MVTSVKHSQFGTFSPSLYQTFSPSPPPLLSNTRESHFGLGSPQFRDYHPGTSHATTFHEPPASFERVRIDPTVRDRLSLAHWEIGTPSTGPVVNTTAGLSFKQRAAGVQGAANKQESIKNKQVMRGHHYSFGGHGLSYETTSHRKEHAQRALEQAQSPEK